jgi:hypothetical protein
LIGLQLAQRQAGLKFLLSFGKTMNGITRKEPLTENQLKRRVQRFILQKCFQSKSLSVERCGIVKQYASPFLLLLDVDAKSQLGGIARRPKIALRRVLKNLASIAHTLPLKIEWLRIERSSGGGGFHVIAKTASALDKVTQVCIQALSGSDPVRERLNLMRARSVQAGKRTDWQYLFKEKL